QRRQVLGVGQVIDGHDVELGGPLEHGPEDEPADAAEAVDTYFDCHDRFSSLRSANGPRYSTASDSRSGSFRISYNLRFFRILVEGRPRAVGLRLADSG